jgi:hypothetical protein
MAGAAQRYDALGHADESVESVLVLASVLRHRHCITFEWRLTRGHSANTESIL